MAAITVGDPTYTGFEALSQGYFYSSLGTVPANGTLTTVSLNAASAAAGATIAGAIYQTSGTTPTTRLALTNAVTGVTAGVNVLTLQTPLAVTSGQTVYIGIHVAGAAVAFRGTVGTGTNRFWPDAAYPPDDPAPAAFSYANRWCIYAEGTTGGGTWTSVAWVM